VPTQDQSPRPATALVRGANHDYHDNHDDHTGPKVKPGTTSSQLTSLTDVMATVAAIIGAKLPDNAAEDSFNMLPAWLGEDQAPIRPYLLQQAFGGERTLSIRRGDWKYLDHTGSGGNRYDNNPGLKPFHLPETAPDAPGQLYNLAADPGETTNLYFKHPEIAKELKTLLERSTSGDLRNRRRDASMKTTQ
jgi:arylsulfatase A